MVFLRIYLVIGIVGAACDRSQDGGGGSTSQSPDGNAQGDKDAGSSEPAPANRFEGYVRTGTAGAPSDQFDGVSSDLLVHPPLVECPPEPQPGSLRVVTWNIKVAELADVDRIAEQIEVLDADVVALQEVDVMVDRTGQIDQARALAEKLDYDYLFAASIKYMRGDYGLAFLTRLPVHHVQRRRHTNRPGPQAGVIALEVTVCAPDGPLRLLNQHSDYRAPQQDVLESLSWFSPDPKAKQIWLGDFNQVPTDPGPVQARDAGWIDTLADDPSTTFADRRIDYILITSALATRLQRAWVVSSPLSDHNAVVAEFAPAP